MNSPCIVQLSSDLARIVREVLALSEVHSARVAPGRACQALRMARSRHEARDSLVADAERELERLHRVELAFLLRQAAELRARPSASTVDVESWRASLREALGCAALDRMQASSALYALLERCLHAALGLWPSASALARASLDLHDVERGRVQLAEAMLAEGDDSSAESACARALARGPSPHAFRRLIAGWTAAARRAGHLERALAIARASMSCEVAA